MNIFNRFIISYFSINQPKNKINWKKRSNRKIKKIFVFWEFLWFVIIFQITQSNHYYTFSNKGGALPCSVHESPWEPFSLYVRAKQWKCQIAWGYRRRCMENLLWWTWARNRRWICTTLWSGIYLPSNDVSSAF